MTPKDLTAALLLLSACTREEARCFFYLDVCEEDAVGGDETDGSSADRGEYWCDEIGVCLLADPDDPLVLKPIDDGLFVPHSLGSCDEPGRTWDAFQRATPIDDGFGGRLQAACCADMGCEALPHQTYAFAICMPGPQTWTGGGAVGAIGFGAGAHFPECDALEPYAFAHEYEMKFECGSVSCLDLRTNCACSCSESADCWSTRDQIETDYGVDAEAWELACTGYPWTWDHFAFETGGWVGTTCEFNQPGPEPGSIPSPLVAVLDEIACAGGACEVSARAIARIALNPGLVMADTIVAPEGDAIVVVECGVLCSAVGLSGATITAVGPERQPPTTARAWFDAAIAWNRPGGVMLVEYETAGEPRTLTINIKL